MGIERTGKAFCRMNCSEYACVDLLKFFKLIPASEKNLDCIRTDAGWRIRPALSPEVLQVDSFSNIAYQLACKNHQQ